MAHCGQIYFVPAPSMRLLTWWNFASVCLILAASQRVQAALNQSPFLRNNSMLHTLSFNQKLLSATSLISSDFHARLSRQRKGPVSAAVSAALQKLLDMQKNASMEETAVAASLELVFNAQQVSESFLSNSLSARASLARYLTHPQAFEADASHKYEVAARIYDTLSACSRMPLGKPEHTHRRILETSLRPSAALPNALVGPVIAYVVATNVSAPFSRLHAWSVTSTLQHGLADRVAFVGAGNEPPTSKFWQKVKHFTQYVDRASFLPELNGSHLHLAAAAALRGKTGVWLHANHILLLPLQGILSNLSQSDSIGSIPDSASSASSLSRDEDASVAFFASRAHQHYSDIDTSFLGVTLQSEIPAQWQFEMLLQANNNCTQVQTCSDAAALGSVIRRHKKYVHLAPRSMLHYPTGSPAQVDKLLFYRGKHVHNKFQAGISKALAMAVPDGAAFKRWVWNRHPQTIQQGLTGMDIVVRHLEHTQPPSAYWKEAMRQVRRLTMQVGG
jgi:hypothetical protein